MQEQYLPQEQQLEQQPQYDDGYDPYSRYAQPMCKHCNERYIDTDQNPNSILCTDCRAHFLKLRVPTWVKIFLLAVAAVFVLSFVFLPVSIQKYQPYLDAGRHMQAKQYVQASRLYSQLLQKANPNPALVLQACEAALKAQDFDTLAITLDTYLVGKSLDESDYAKATKYQDFLNELYGTMDQVNAVFMRLDPTLQQDDPVYLQQVQDEMLPLLRQPEMNKALIYYYLASTAPDADIAAGYFSQIVQSDSRITFHFANYGNALRRAGRLEEAAKIYANALSRNADDVLCLRGKSILELLGGQKEQALVNMRAAYTLKPTESYMPEAMIIILCENGLREEAEQILKELTEAGHPIEQDLLDYMDGKLTARQYYIPEEDA